MATEHKLIKRLIAYRHIPILILLTTFAECVLGEEGNMNFVNASNALPKLSVFAGILGQNVILEGAEVETGFRYPYGIASDSKGNVYVSDYRDNVIRKITPDGAVSVFAGTAGFVGNMDGVWGSATFAELRGVAIDSRDNLYVVSGGYAAESSSSIRKITPAGVVSTVASAKKWCKQSDANCFDTPNSIAIDGVDNIYVTDRNGKIFKLTPSGVMTVLADIQAYYVSDTRARKVACGTGDAAKMLLMLPVFPLVGGGPHGSRDSGGSDACSIPEYSNLNLASDKAGNLYVANPIKRIIHKISPDGVVSTFAGSTNKKGISARFGWPNAVATDNAGNVYVADNGTIRKINSDGVVSTLAGTAGVEGHIDGSGNKARFKSPVNMAADRAGNIYVTQYGETEGSVRKITPTGVVSTLAGEEAYYHGHKDGMRTAARFRDPMGVTTDSAGNVYVTDSGGGAIRKIAPGGEVSTLVVNKDYSSGLDGVPIRTDLINLRDVAIDSRSNFYVIHLHEVHKITPDGIVSKYGGGEYLAVDRMDNVFVANGRIIKKISPEGVVSTLAGGGAEEDGNKDGIGAAARFTEIKGIATDNAGNVYVTDDGYYYYNSEICWTTAIRKITPAGMVRTLAGTTCDSGLIARHGAGASFEKLSSIALDSAGNVYVLDGNMIDVKLTVRKITPAGMVSTITNLPVWGVNAIAIRGTSMYLVAGEGVAVLSNLTGADKKENSKEKNKTKKGGATAAVPELALLAGNLSDSDDSWKYLDGLGAAATFKGLANISADATGNVYVIPTSQWGEGSIRKITPAGLVSTVPLNALPGDRLLEERYIKGWRYGALGGITTDKKGNLFVICSNAIRKITPAGKESILAGDPKQSGSEDGIGKGARFGFAEGLAIDSMGNLYVTDAPYQGTPKIRKITPAGVVSTLAVTAAAYQASNGIAVDMLGNVYAADMLAHIVRKITPAGVVSTFAGKAGESGNKDGKGEEARFNRPEGLATDSDGNVYVADHFNYTIRKITPEGDVTTIVGTPGQERFDADPLPGRLMSPRAVAVSGSSLYIAMERGVAVVRNLPGLKK